MAKYATEFEALRAAVKHAQVAMNTYRILVETQRHIAPEVNEAVTASQDALTTLLQGLANGQLDTQLGEAFKDAVHALHLVIVREKARPMRLQGYKEQLRELEEESTRMADKAGKSKAPVPDEYNLRWNEANAYIKNYDLHPSIGIEGHKNSYSVTPLRNELKRAYAALYRAVQSDKNLLVNLQYPGIENDLAQGINDNQTDQQTGTITSDPSTESKRSFIGSMASSFRKLSWSRSRGAKARKKATSSRKTGVPATPQSKKKTRSQARVHEGDRELDCEGGRGYFWSSTMTTEGSARDAVWMM